MFNLEKRDNLRWGNVGEGHGKSLLHMEGAYGFRRHTRTEFYISPEKISNIPSYLSEERASRVLRAIIKGSET